MIDPPPTIRHPDGLFCPSCGCGSIWYWVEIDGWDKMAEEEKHSFEVCPCCGYGDKYYDKYFEEIE